MSELFKIVSVVMVLAMLSIATPPGHCVCGLFANDSYDEINSFLKSRKMSKKTPEEIVDELSVWRQSESELEATCSRSELLRMLDRLIQLPESLKEPTRCTKQSIEILKSNDAAVGANIYSANKKINRWSPVRKLVVEFAIKHYHLCGENYYCNAVKKSRTSESPSHKLAEIGDDVSWHILETKYPRSYTEKISDARYRKLQIALLQTNSINGRDVYEALVRVMEKYGNLDDSQEKQLDKTRSGLDGANRETIGALIEHSLVEPCKCFVDYSSDILVPAENDLILARKLVKGSLPDIYRAVSGARLCRLFFLDKRSREKLAADTEKYIADARAKRQLARFSTKSMMSKR